MPYEGYAENFTTFLYSVFLSFAKCALKAYKNFLQNCLVIVKAASTIRTKFFVTAITFSEKKIGGTAFEPPQA
jgi:hypothetical protein